MKTCDRRVPIVTLLACAGMVWVLAACASPAPEENQETLISPGLSPHCSVAIIRCQEIGPAYYRPGCWDAVFKIELQGSPLSLLGRVANKLSRDGPAAPAILASLQKEDGTFVALAPEWPTMFGPTMADFPWDVTLNWADPCEKAVRVANGDWRIFWKFGLVCSEMPVGRVRVALNGPAILEHLWQGEVAWKSDPTTCTVPPLK